MIPVNCPYAGKPRNYVRDGPMCVDGNQGNGNIIFILIFLINVSVGGAPNYYPNSFNGPKDMGKHDVTIFPAVRR